MNINKFIDEDCGHAKEGEYVLYGIGNHSGTINFGHYFAYIKLNDKAWYEFNDSKVKLINGLPETDKTFLLFYQLIH